MKTVIFHTENAAFKFDQKEVIEHLTSPESGYKSDEVSQLLKLISPNSDETILSSADHHYFGYFALELIGSGKALVTCKLCRKAYDVGQLKEFAIGYGKSPFDINQEKKGEIPLFGNKKNPSMFGGAGYKCSKNHELISMITWRT